MNTPILSTFLNLLSEQLKTLVSPIPEGTICCKDIYKAACNGHLECLKYFHSSTKDFRWDPMIISYTARNQHIDCLKYAYENGCEWHPETTYKISCHCNLEILKYVHENGCPWHPKTTYQAVAKGKLEFLKYAHENGCPWNGLTIKYAAENGHLDCLKYLHSQGCEWDKDTTYVIAQSDNFNLDCLKYVRENGCPWTNDTTSNAAYFENLDCLLYCLDNNCPIDPKTLDNLYTPGYRLNSKKINKNLITNILFRKVLLHPKLKYEISYEKYPKFVELIKEYDEFKNKIYKLLHLKTTLPTDIIKYEVLKYI